MHIKDLIAQISSDTRERVAQAYKVNNALIRETMRSETRLRFSPSSSIGERHEESRVSVAVDKVGYPETIGNKAIMDSQQLAALLALWRPDLTKLRESATNIVKMLETQWRILSRIPEIQQKAHAVPDAKGLVERLLQELLHFDLVKEVLAVHEDILGHYFYDAQEGGIGDTPQRTGNRIVLYWGVIGLIAQTLGVSTEGLTIVVLTHELAHAFSHLGFDIDGRRWTGQRMAKSETSLIEGLAQYYTALVLKRLETRLGDAYKAFTELLEKQPAPYQSHSSWLEMASPEAVRAVLVACRRAPNVTLAGFEEQLCIEVERLSQEWSSGNLFD
jgi:hypothetical protein